jgi:glycosyltransferase involved in cell wall biosynthesis
MTNVLVSARVYDKQVGGNTRYVRTVYGGIESHGVKVTFGRPPIQTGNGKLRSIAYAASESVAWPLNPGKDIDLIHYPADTGAAVKGRVPIVSTVHGLATSHVDGIRSPASDWLWKCRVRRLIAVSERIITVSHSSARDIVSFAPGSSRLIEVIPHGIDHTIFNPEGAERDAALIAELDIAGDYFLYVGNLEPRKNVIELARGASTIFEETGIPLVIAGSLAWNSDEIARVINTTPGVQYIGRVSEEALVPLLRNAMAFCFPSTYEGFGFPVLEAMACGTPVLCSDRGSLKEVAADAAFVINLLDSKTIADGLREIARDPGLRMDLRVRGLVNAAKYRWGTTIIRHAEVFTQVAK